ncbi:MAG: hypothetical protein WD042_02300 [Phycisphaeraceae bacterium]
MIIEKHARPTLTAAELDTGDQLHFTLASGVTRRIKLVEANASVYRSNLDTLPKPGPLASVVLRMSCRLEIDGHQVCINRWVGNQDSFYEPWELMGIRLWFDGCAPLFKHLSENHGACKPRKLVRLAVQDASLRVCPVLLHPWCPLPVRGLRIEDCYQGSDCWMGPYFGVDAHGGLDINHPAGTPIWTPIAVDSQGYFNSLGAGDNNNRWRGIRRWDDGSTWILQVHHILRLLVPEGGCLDAGVHMAQGAGVHVGSHEHSHFVFGVIEPGGAEDDKILLDPWILFWQMYQDRRLTATRS